METKAITTLFTERGTVVCPAATVNGKLHGIESLFEGCDSKLADAEMSGCGYTSQSEAINTMTENMRQLSLYAATAHERVSEELDQPLYEHFKKNATETITAIKLSEITTDNTFGLSEYVEIERQGQHIRYKRAKANLTMEDFLGIQEITAEDGTPILENVETVSEFASLFRKDYDTMTKKDMSLDEYLEWYADSGDDSHKGYHPVADMISGIADIIILKPMIECIIGKDIITGEYLTEEELDWKAAGMCIDLITLGMGSKALAGAKSLKEILKISGKTLVVDALSATATYSTAYIGEELGLSEESIFILSMLAGGSVSYASGKVLLKNADEVVKGVSKTRIFREATQQDVDLISDIKTKYNAGKTRNAASAKGTINGESIDLECISGKFTHDNYYNKGNFEPPQPENYHYEGPIPEYTNHTEQKIVEYLREQFKDNPNVSGEIEIISERIYCDNCKALVDMFEEEFPNIKVTRVEVIK